MSSLNPSAITCFFKKCMKGFAISCIVFFSSITHAQLNANFTADTTQGCELLELALENLSTDATSYLWEIYDEDGTLVTSSSLTNPSFFLTEPGAYTVVLTAYDAGGGSDVLTIDDFAFVYTNPESDFTASEIDGCPPLTVTFTDMSSPGTYGSISEYYWVITGAPTLPSTPTVDYTFTAGGTYTVYLFVTDEAGCSDYSTQTITIYDGVTADFTSDVSVGCNLPFDVNFTNLSLGSGSLLYEWDFGDGSGSTALNPSHTYSSYGNYDVSLIVTNSESCTDTLLIDDFIQLNPTADVDFAVLDSTICVGESISFDNLSGSSTGTWLWNFGDGSSSTEFEPTHTYTTAGTYDVSLSGDFGGGCTGGIVHNNIITVVSAPTVSFTSTDPTAVCQLPWSVTFTPTVTGGPISDYSWQFEEATGTVNSNLSNPTNNWNTFGTFDVTLTVTNSNGCSATYTAPDYVSIGEFEVTPIATPFSGCVPLAVDFSAIAGEPISTYSWDLGDGTTSTSATPSNIYEDIGCYTISLIATSVSGCEDTTEFIDYVCAGDTVTADLIVPDTACPGTPLEVYYLPLDSITAIVDGGLDNSSASPVDSTTTINLPTGDHDVDFITWSYGCPDTISAHIFILEVDDSLLQVNYNCDNPYEMQIFIDTAIAALSCGWLWEFGDGEVDSVNMNPVHEYDSAGTYSVSLTYYCITPEPCQGVGVSVEIQVPFANFTADPFFGCDTPLVINFTNTSTDYIDDNLSYLWTFGDGSPTDTMQNQTHTYSDFGEYIVTLDITDDRGCVDDFSDTVGISIVSAGYDVADDAGCAPFMFSLTDTSSSTFGEMDMWILDWDDGTIDTFYNYSDVVGLDHLFTYQDKFKVELTAYNEYGCSDVFVDTITVGDPLVDFTVDDTIPCIGQFIYFTELCSGYGLDYFWDFGDGFTSTDANPFHTYSSLGFYDVSLTVTDVNGCVSDTIKPYFIETDTISGDFSASVLVASCNYSLIQFTSSTVDSVCEYLWEFGDGGISVEPNPIYPYLTAGAYDVTLTITDCNGCSSTIYKSGYVLVPGPFGTISFSDDTLCVDHEMEIYLSVASTDTLTMYFDNGDVIYLDVEYSDTLETITVPYTYTDAGTYLPNALLIDTNGCFNIIEGADSIRVGNNPTANYSIPDAIACIGSEFIFSDSSSGIDAIEAWIWNLGDGILISDSSETFSHYYSDTGFYQTSLFVYTEYGCVDSMFADVNVLPYPVIELTDDSVFCPGQTVQLLASGGTSYLWSPPDGLSAIDISNPLATPDTTTLYTVEVSNGYCSSFDSVLLTIVDDLILYAGPDTQLCMGAEIQLFSEFITNVDINNIDFYWTPSDDLSDASVQNPISNTLNDITYSIFASCGNLDDSANAIIQIATPPDIEIPEDTIIIIQGQTIEISSELIGGEGVIIYQWEPVSEVDCASCESVFVSPQTNAIYSVQVTDEFGCTDIDFVLLKVLTCDETLFFIPNIISPNNDGLNDRFVFTYEGISIVEGVKIYDRWGELMFQTSNLDITWDGTFNGVICNPGVYVYTIEAVCFDGTKTVIAGNITLIK